jgi:hypothetical protein
MYNKSMTTVDQILTQIVNYSSTTIEELVSNRDARILRSMLSAITSSNYITENQSRLLLKILRENQEKLGSDNVNLVELLHTPSWSRAFRMFEQTKKLYISNSNDESVLTVEISYSSALAKEIANISKSVPGISASQGGKLYYAELTEKNIITLVSRLKKLDFEIDQKLQNYYEIIQSWIEAEVRDRFKIDTITYPNFHKQITNDLGINTPIDQNIINDRSLRYQYFSEKSEKNPENLTEIIATRSGRQVWINKTETNLSEIFDSLHTLKRFPLLVIFDSNDQKKCLEELVNLSEILEKNGIVENVGIYFRLGNDGVGKDFNQLIANKKYNSQLDSTTKVVGIASGKIPKFLLKTDWKPMSTISIGKLLQHNKTSVYANCCDLIINWSDTQPIVEARSAWQ